MKPSVHLSVCPSNACIVTKRKKTSAKIFYATKERSIIPVLWQKKWLVGTTPCTWNFGPNWPRPCKNADFLLVFARNAAAVTPTEQSLTITNKNSTTRFPTSLGWTAYVACKPPKGVKKRKMEALFLLKVHFSRI